jgi:hypothetical protein
MVEVSTSLFTAPAAAMVAVWLMAGLLPILFKACN